MKEPKRLTITNLNFPDRTVKEKTEWVSKEDYDYWRIEAETDHARWIRTLEENEKLRAEVERLRKAGEWQPIDTAPKDGTKVLVYDESYGLPQKAWFGKDHFDEEHEGWLFGDGDDYSCGLYFTPINPTHWMPLPKPPQEGKQP